MGLICKPDLIKVRLMIFSILSKSMGLPKSENQHVITITKTVGPFL